MKRRVILILAVVLALFASTFANSFRSVSAQGKSLTVWMTGSDDDATAFKAAADLWSKTSKVDVNVQAVSWGDAYAKMLAAVTSGSGPDIITGGLSFGIQLGAKGGMVDLAAKYPDDVAAIKKAANEGIWTSLVSTDGKTFAVPYDLTVQLFYYRPDILQKAGIKEAPKTWEELTAAVEAVRKLNGGKGGLQFGWGNNDWIAYFPFLYQNGGDFYSADCKEVVVNDEKGVGALKAFAKFYTDYGAPTDASDPLTPFADGTYPMLIDGSWELGSIDTSKPEIKGKWAVALLPAGPAKKSTAFIGGRGIGIMSFSKSPDDAMSLIKYMYTKDASKAIIDVAVSKNAIFFPPATEFQDLMPLGDNLKAVQAQLADAIGPPNCAGFEETNKDLTTQIQNVVLKGADAQDALDTAADSMKTGLSAQ